MPVYLSNEDYAPKGAATPEEKRELRRIFSEGYAAKMSVGTVHVYILSPDVAYFGAKDFQQQLIIRHAVQDLNLPVEIRTIDTVREPDGLALSSRNRYLDTAQRKAAGVLWQALSAAHVAVREGERDANRVRQILTTTIESEKRAALDYAEVADADTLTPLNVLSPGVRAVGLLAVRFGSTRLIDNTVLSVDDLPSEATVDGV